MSIYRQLVVASNNQGKLREFSTLLSQFSIDAVPQSQFNVPEVDEPYPTFVENALIKARNACRHSGLPALADDSGICVDTLNGQPGVKSARFADGPRSDRSNNEKLIELMKEQIDRRAYYYCVIVLLRHVDDPQPLIAEGTWFGEIVLKPKGMGGFGYDPYFFLPDLGKTAAELSSEHKNRISHRGKALNNLAAFFGDQDVVGA